MPHTDNPTISYTGLPANQTIKQFTVEEKRIPDNWVIRRRPVQYDETEHKYKYVGDPDKGPFERVYYHSDQVYYQLSQVVSERFSNPGSYNREQRTPHVKTYKMEEGTPNEHWEFDLSRLETEGEALSKISISEASAKHDVLSSAHVSGWRILAHSITPIAPGVWEVVHALTATTDSVVDPTTYKVRVVPAPNNPVITNTLPTGNTNQ